MNGSTSNPYGASPFDAFASPPGGGEQQQQSYHQQQQFPVPAAATTTGPPPYSNPPSSNPPYGGGYPSQQQQQQHNGGAMVVSATQSNPYAIMPYGMPPPTPSPLGGSSNYNDPFPSAPANTLVAPPPPREIQTFQKTNTADPPGAPAQHSVDPPAHTPVDALAAPPGTTYPPQFEYGQKATSHNTNEPNASSKEARNKYSEQLARQAPPGASALPRADIVGKKGYVLSRISFRTIVMKKWKQSFWVQYGPHTMLWFRSEADFDDWLNNPYHQQSERNYLIKLAINFVHDLYKPNVRGYQVTQCRTKAYGSKMVRQFKLERWMDYGPTIAAAFGSYDPAEVDALREAVVECMRNTPLNNGIRATGAVRQRPPNHEPKQEPSRHSSYEELPKDRKETESVAEETDLLDLNNWDDVPTDTSPAFAGSQAMVPSNAPPTSPWAVAPQQYQASPQYPPNQLPSPQYPPQPSPQYPPQPSPQYPPQPSTQYPQQPSTQYPNQQPSPQHLAQASPQMPPHQQASPQMPPPQQYPPQQPPAQQGYSTNPWGM